MAGLGGDRSGARARDPRWRGRAARRYRLDRIRAESINVQEMENVIFEGSEAAVARINLEGGLSSNVLEKLKADNADIIELSLLEIKG